MLLVSVKDKNNITVQLRGIAEEEHSNGRWGLPSGCLHVTYYDAETANESLPGKKSRLHNYLFSIIVSVKINKKENSGKYAKPWTVCY